MLVELISYNFGFWCLNKVNYYVVVVSRTLGYRLTLFLYYVISWFDCVVSIGGDQFPHFRSGGLTNSQRQYSTCSYVETIVPYMAVVFIRRHGSSYLSYMVTNLYCQPMGRSYGQLYHVVTLII